MQTLWGVRIGETMEHDIDKILDVSIALELQVADLYLLFCHQFPHDGDFWWTLMLEEQNHAALLRSIKEVFVPRGNIPEKMLAGSYATLAQTCAHLRYWHEHYRKTAPARIRAFNLALNIESSAAELHFQRYMDRNPGNKMDEVFQQLNADDKDHARRIREYMEAHGIEEKPAEGYLTPE
jgi:hypothetical protein